MRVKLRRRKLLLPLAALAVAASIVSVAFAATGGGGQREIRIAIMTDCKGAFGFGYELDIGGAQAALYQYARARPIADLARSDGLLGLNLARARAR